MRPKICFFGDSIFAGVENVEGYSYLRPVADLVRFQINCETTNLAVGSTKWSHALTYWNALSAGTKSSFDFIITEGFYNGEDIPTAQLLYDQLLIDKQASCKIISCACPAATPPVINWADYNIALSGQGPSPLVGMDSFVDEFNDLLASDASGNLASQYWTSVSDKIHANYAGKEVIADSIVQHLKTVYGVTV